MYNRYIPQNDGSFHRNRMPDPCRPTKPPAPPAPAPQPECPPPSEPCPKHSQSGQCAGGFLRQLMPKEFDTGDLLIVLLLLLMAGDCEEEKHNALLTLALYFFM